MTKILYVSSVVQAALMTQIFIPELMDGFWKNHRPAGHGDVWRDVQVKVTENGDLGCVGFATPRKYNFLNLDFALPNEAKLVIAAKTVKESATFKSIKKELIELGQIVDGRLKHVDDIAIKLFRGNHPPGTVTYSSSKARQSSQALGEAGATLHTALQASAAMNIAAAVEPKRAVKKTVVKAKPDEAGVTISKSSAGATVRRVAVSNT